MSTNFDVPLKSEEQERPAGFRVSVSKGSLAEFDALRAAYHPQFECDTIDREARASFEFESENYHLGVTRLASLKSSGWRYERSGRHSRRSISDAISIGLYFSGRHSGVADGIDMDFGAGDIAVTQVDRPTKLVSSTSESIRILIERQAIAPLVADINSVHGLVLRSGTPLNALLATYLQELKAQAGRLGPVEARAIGQATAALVGACLNATPGSRDKSAGGVPITKITQIRQTIEANLGNPALGPDFVASSCGLSRASLYRLTEPFGGVRKYIQDRRLECALADILDIDKKGQRIGVIAARWGFTDAAVFSRAFSVRYGMSPREASRERQAFYSLNSAHISPDGGGFAALNDWLKATGI